MKNSKILIKRSHSPVEPPKVSQSSYPRLFKLVSEKKSQHLMPS